MKFINHQSVICNHQAPRRWPLVLGLWLAVCALQAQGQAQGPAPTPTPVLLSIEAQTRRVDSLVVIRAAGFTPGDRLTVDNLQTAIKQIYAVGLFSQVEADTTMIADGVRLVFRVTEFPHLRTGGVHIVGNHLITTKDLMAKLAIGQPEAAAGSGAHPEGEGPHGGGHGNRSGSEAGQNHAEPHAPPPGAAPGRELLTGTKVFEWTQKLSDFYRAKGFVLAKVTSQVTPPDAHGEVEVTLFVDEGSRVRIRKISINGAMLVPQSVLLSKMVNKPYLWPFHNGNLNETELKKDLERITDCYKEKGFLDARVLNDDLHYDSGAVSITINVSEGLKYYFGALAFRGESLFTNAQLQPVLHAQRGDIYNQKKVNQVLTDLFTMYSEQGYIYAQIQPMDSIRYDTVDVLFQINENQPARVRLVDIQGNDRTMDKVIRREIVSMPGDPFKRSEVLRSQQNIYNLGYFDDVSLDYQRLGDTAPDIDLTYKVKEKFAGNVGAGVSYSATDGIVGNVSFSHPNMFGRGQQMNVTVEYGKKVTNFQFGYTEPWLFDTPTSLGAELTWMTQAWDNFDKRDRGGDLNFSRPLPLDYSRAYLTLHGGDVTLSDIKTGTTANPGDTFPETTISTTLRFDRDSRDYIFNPSSGSYSSYSIELAGADVAGDVNYIRQTFESDFYYPLFWKFVLRFRGRFGIVGGWRSADTVPPYELFFPGGTGDDAVRGYPDRSLPNLVGANPGGLAEAIFSVEYRLKLSRSIALLAFYDAGNAWSSLRDINLSDLKRGVGAGVRLEIPMLGWLGFDLGYGFDRPGTASKFEPHLQIGTGFPLSF